MWEAWWQARLAYAKETSVTSDRTCGTDDVTSIVEETADVFTVKDYSDVTVPAINAGRADFQFKPQLGSWLFGCCRC